MACGGALTFLTVDEVPIFCGLKRDHLWVGKVDIALFAGRTPSEAIAKGFSAPFVFAKPAAVICRRGGSLINVVTLTAAVHFVKQIVDTGVYAQFVTQTLAGGLGVGMRSVGVRIVGVRCVGVRGVGVWVVGVRVVGVRRACKSI